MNTYKTFNLEDITSKDTYNLLLQNTITNLDISVVADTFSATNKSILVVTPNLYNAQNFYDNLSTLVGEDNVLFYPQDELISVDMLVSSSEFRLERINTLNSLLKSKPYIVVTHLQGFLKKQLPKQSWLDTFIEIKLNEDIDVDNFISNLVSYGYTRDFTVSKPGSFTVRGSIIDVYPLDSKYPKRIELFDTEVDSIREYDPNSQLSIGKVKDFRITPLFELFYNDDTLHNVMSIIEDKASKLDLNEADKDVLETTLQNISSRSNLESIHKYITFFTDTTSTIQSFMDNPITVFSNIPDLLKSYDNHVLELSEYYVSSSKLNQIAFSYYEDLYSLLSTATKSIYTQTLLKKNSTLKYTDIINTKTLEPIDYYSNKVLLLNDLKNSSKNTINVNFTTFNLYNTFKKFLNDNDIYFNDDKIVPNEINVLFNQPILPFTLIDKQIINVNENNVYNVKATKKPKYKSNIKDITKIESTDELQPGDYVVHYDHGVGRYIGLVTKEYNKIKCDYLEIQYSGDDKLLIPIENIKLVSKFSSKEGVIPKLSTLGGSDWNSTKKK